MTRALSAPLGSVGWRLAALVALLVVLWLPFAVAAQSVFDGPAVDGSGAIVPAIRPDQPALDGGAPGQGAVSGGGSGGSAAGVSAAATGGGVPAVLGVIDYAAFNATAVRAEAATLSSQSTDAALEFLRTQLVDWRGALLGAQNANAARIVTLRTQIAALGPVPDEGATEADEIAARRSALTDQLVRLQAPGIAADEGYSRADGLIREIDRVLRERQAEELLRLWPTPINPTNWTAGLGALSRLAVTLWDETTTRWADPVARGILADNLPLIVLAIVFAVAVLWRGRRWIDGQVGRLLTRTTARGARLWGFLTSLGLIVVPTLAMFALARALQLTDMLGEVGRMIAQELPDIAFPLFAAIWLGGRIFPSEAQADPTVRLNAERRTGARILTSSFGALLSVDLFRVVAFGPLDLTDAAVSVLSFPIIAVAGSLLFRIGQVLLRQAAAEFVEDRPSFQARMIGVLGRVAMGVGIVGPLLAAVGYGPAAQAMVYPAAISLWLIGLLFILQRLIGDIHALVMREAEADYDGLVPVLAGFVLTLATLPLFALIWGARRADITEMWTRFREGFVLGETRVSPTDFLLFGIIFALGYGLTRVLQGALKASVLPRTSLDQGGQNAVVSGLGYVGIFLAGLVAINSTGIDLSGLAIVAGALSVGIGFGLQAVVSNFVSGIILLIERPVSEGDWIEVGGVQGIVKSISVRSTRIQTFDRSDVIVPNSDLISGRVTNWTRFNLTGRLIVPVGVAFGSDTRKVERLLREIAEEQPMAILNPPPLIVLAGFGTDAINFEIRVILRDVNFSLSVRTEINHRILERFAEENIEIPFAQSEVFVRNIDELGRAFAELRGPPDLRAALASPSRPPNPEVS